jgi:hypothetical protein
MMRVKGELACFGAVSLKEPGKDLAAVTDAQYMGVVNKL